MRLGFIVQRYGEQINGGAESHCRQIAERLAVSHQVEVFTTCASDYRTWANQLAPGSSELNGVQVHRLPVHLERVPHLFDASYQFLVHLYQWIGNYNQPLPERYSGTDLQRYLSVPAANIPALGWKGRFFLYWMRRAVEKFWMVQQGPHSPELVSLVRRNARKFDALFFFSYTYATTFFGLSEVAGRSVLIPTAHDDPCLGFEVFDRLFRQPRYFIYQTPEEQQLIEKRFPSVRSKRSVVSSIGIEPPCPSTIGDLASFGLSQPYILYLGRIERSKGCAELLEHFRGFRERQPALGLTLVMAGQAFMPIADEPGVVYAGFVSDQEKWSLLAKCCAFVMPSPYESLSIVCLEAWALGRPVLASRRCPALVGQCERSRGGLLYDNTLEFEQALCRVMTEKGLADNLGANGRRFVEGQYQWDDVCASYLDAARHVRG